MKIPKGWSESINQRTNNIMAKRKSKDRVTLTSLKTGGELRCSFCNEMRQFHPRVNIFCHQKLGMPCFWLENVNPRMELFHLTFLIMTYYYNLVSNLSVTHVQACEKNILFILLLHSKNKAVSSLSWSWSYGSWIYPTTCAISAYHH